MIIDSVDPGDIEWEVDQPVYRVYFWHQPLAPLGWIPQQHLMYHCDECRVCVGMSARTAARVLLLRSRWISPSQADESRAALVEVFDVHSGGLPRSRCRLRPGKHLVDILRVSSPERTLL